MKTTMMIGCCGVIAAAVCSTTAFADDSYTRKESVTTQSSNERPVLGTETETTRTTTNTTEYRGTVKRVDPSHTVVVVDGVDYSVSGPQASTLSTQVDKSVTIYGRMDRPKKTIEIERYQTVE